MGRFRLLLITAIYSFQNKSMQAALLIWHGWSFVVSSEQFGWDTVRFSFFGVNNSVFSVRMENLTFTLCRIAKQVVEVGSFVVRCEEMQYSLLTWDPCEEDTAFFVSKWLVWVREMCAREDRSFLCRIRSCWRRFFCSIFAFSMYSSAGISADMGGFSVGMCVRETRKYHSS